MKKYVVVIFLILLCAFTVYKLKDNILLNRITLHDEPDIFNYENKDTVIDINPKQFQGIEDYDIGSENTQANDSELEEIDKEINKSNQFEGSKDKDMQIIEIKEKMFLTQINEIYYNIDDYKGKVIKVEGMYTKFASDFDESEGVDVVYRNGPGCCGDDGWGGFLLNYDGEYPEDNAWIQVIGTPAIVEDGDFRNLYLNVTSITVLEERGEESVYQ